ncbi:hypothetical protein [Mucilaginibacter sp.]
MKPLLTVAMLVLTFAVNAQTKSYKLISKVSKADFNYKVLDAFTDEVMALKGRRSPEVLFAPVKGNYSYYKFIATYKGVSFTDKVETFHDIIIIKTSSAGGVVDAYQYTLEWAEVPFSYDLFRSSAKHVKLVNNIAVRSLNFKRVDRPAGEDSNLKDEGVLEMANFKY